MDVIIDYIVEHGLKALIFWIIGALTVFLLFGIFNLNISGDFPGIDKNKWQAVFLENGQVYFGKLKEYDQHFVTLENVYYLKSAAEIEGESTANLNLIKLGGEVHGPENEMFIRKESILYFENLKDTSRVVRAITESGE